MSETIPRLPSKDAEPAWEAAYLLPRQGCWREEDFFKLHTNRMAELVAGRLEVLPMPTWLHQLIVDFLLTSIKRYLHDKAIGGIVLMAPLPTKLFPGTIREPDLLFVRPENFPTDANGYPEKINLAVEVVSQGVDARKRDYEDKRLDYARAGVSEYWIVDPEASLFSVLTLDSGQYQVLQECRHGDMDRSQLLEGLVIPVDPIWALGESKKR